MYDRPTRATLSGCLADAFLAGAWNERGLADRAGQALTPPRPRWIRPLVREVLGAYHRPPADRPRELTRFVALQLELMPPSSRNAPRVRRWFVAELAMGRRRWPVPELASVAALAGWLDVGLGHLDWLADARGLERTTASERLRNYRYVWLARAAGPPRLIERPKARLKAIQRRLLHEILDWIPAHESAHGFTRGRSVASHAAAHTGRLVVVSLDLEDFFASVAAGRVFGVFRTAGYPEPVAHALTALTTNAVPVEEWASVRRPRDPGLVGAHHRLGRRLATPHLPQGAPTSPALANLAAFALDRRLEALAQACGVTYTRYADDLTFSGPVSLLRGADRFRSSVADIAREEGFRVNARKSALMTRAGRQRVCGVVVNQHLNVARAEYDQLKAILHNAARSGPSGQNRHAVADFRAHLLGRIAWVESLNPGRGKRLRARFDVIDWGR
jgi:GNAT superfamily N-acetyltransferase